jgi:nicotinamide riboside kinase
MKINVAIGGGPCTGKSTLAATLFSALKVNGWDYDLVTEESRKLVKEFGHFRSPFERFYMWRQQEREELRSSARDGFVTDTPLFHYYVQAEFYASEPRDKLAIRELFRMCLEIEDRYQLIVIARNPCEIGYKTDQSRSIDEKLARKKHDRVVALIRWLWPERLLFVHGNIEERTNQVIKRLEEMRN